MSWGNSISDPGLMGLLLNKVKIGFLCIMVIVTVYMFCIGAVLNVTILSTVIFGYKITILTL